MLIPSTHLVEQAVGTARTLVANCEEDVRAWESLIDNSHLPDVYHRPGYASAYETIGQGEAVAVLVESHGMRALFPLLLRPLNGLPFALGEGGFDAITPYGYGGVALLDGADRVEGEQATGILAALQDWCRENDVVSVHIRLHPMLRQETWFRSEPERGISLHLLSPTTALDLSNWNHDNASIATLSKGRRSDLAFARRSLSVTWLSQGRHLQPDLQTFYDLYEQRMTEIGARGHYHFEFAYYEALAQGLGHRFDVGIAWLGEAPVGAAIFMNDHDLSHYHLSATNDLGRSHKANTLILNAAVQRARELGCRYLHLGGGARGEDKLWEFKRSFGGPCFRYSFLGVIGDRDRYDRLAARRAALPDMPAVDPNFFPGYRA